MHSRIVANHRPDNDASVRLKAFQQFFEVFWFSFPMPTFPSKALCSDLLFGRNPIQRVLAPLHFDYAEFPAAFLLIKSEKEDFVRLVYV